MRDEGQLEKQIAHLLGDPQYDGHPLREALAALFAQHQEQLAQIERVTSISDGYHSALRQRNESLAERYRKQIRQLQKIVRISDHYQEMLREANEALKVASTQDHLTGLANRRLMIERLNSEAAAVQRNKNTFCIAVIDIDHFKQINDGYGHDVGDAVLIEVARGLSKTLRAYDVCARWGGEEFLVLLPETDGAQAQETANRIRSAISALRFQGLPPDLGLSVSVGLCQHAVEASVEESIKRADLALYEAKKQGRDRVVLSP
jgi:diguanylate cyclase (GGDEF)-like protein